MAFPPVPFQEWFLRQTSTGNAALNAYVARVKADGGVVEAIGCVPLAVWDWAAPFGPVAPTAPTLLLDLFPNAAAAYSLRKLRAAYSGAAVRVRRSSDNTEQDIAFDANGGLDTASLLSFVNTGEVFTNPDITSATGWTLGSNTTYNASTEAFDLVAENGLAVHQLKSVNGHTFAITIVLDSVTSGGIKIYAGGTQSAVISTAGTHTLNIVGGSSNGFLAVNPSGAATCSISSFSAIDTTADGHVTTWYDQSLSNDATQTTAANQPKIVSAGSLVPENGKAAIDFDGVNDNFSISVGITAGFSIFGVYKNTKAASFLVGTSPELGRQSNNQYRFYDSTFSANGGTHSDSQVLLTGIEDDTNATIYANGTQIAQAASTFTNGTFDAIGSGFPDGNFQEIILFDSDQSANRTGIETNINDFYSIYP